MFKKHATVAQLQKCIFQVKRLIFSDCVRQRVPYFKRFFEVMRTDLLSRWLWGVSDSKSCTSQTSVQQHSSELMEKKLHQLLKQNSYFPSVSISHSLVNSFLCSVA